MAAWSQHEELVEARPHAGRGLVDGDEDGACALLGDVSECAEDDLGKRRVETGERLVQKEQLRLSEPTRRDRGGERA